MKRVRRFDPSETDTTVLKFLNYIQQTRLQEILWGLIIATGLWPNAERVYEIDFARTHKIIELHSQKVPATCSPSRGSQIHLYSKHYN